MQHTRGDGSTIQASFCAPPPQSFAETAALASRVERAGLRALWLYDVITEWPDPYPHIAVALAATSSLVVGPLVSTPALRPPQELCFLAATMAQASAQRFELALGRGDASVRSLGRAPASLESLQQAIMQLRRAREQQDDAVNSWAAVHGSGTALYAGAHVPIWIGTYGPRGLELAGEFADGVVLQFADPELVRWACSWIERGAQRGGRCLQDVKLAVVCAASFSPSLARAADECRWFVDMVARDLHCFVDRPEGQGWSSQLRQALAGFRQGTALELDQDVYERLTHSLCLWGEGPQMRTRLEQLRACGVGEFAIYSGHAVESSLEQWVRVVFSS